MSGVDAHVNLLISCACEFRAKVRMKRVIKFFMVWMLAISIQRGARTESIDEQVVMPDISWNYSLNGTVRGI